MAELFRLLVSAATLAGMARQAAQRWRGPTDCLRHWLVRAAEVKRLDETRYRVAGRTQSLPGLSTSAWTFYRTHP